MKIERVKGMNEQRKVKIELVINFYGWYGPVAILIHESRTRDG